MIRDNQRVLNLLHVVLDGLLVAVSYMLAYWVRFHSFFSKLYPPPGHALPMEVYFSLLYYLVPAYLVLNFFYALYRPKRATLFRYELWGIIKANLTGLIGFLVVLYIVKMNDVSRAMIFIFFFLNILLSVVMRLLIRRVLRFFRRRGYNLKHVLLIGYSRAAEGYISRVAENPQWGYVVNGILADNVPVGTKYRNVSVIGMIAALPDLISYNDYDEIIISLSLDDYDRLEQLVALCEKSGVHTKFIPDYMSLFPSDPYTEDILGLPVINIRHVPLTDLWNRGVKRLTDLIGSIVAIIVFSPVMLFATCAIKLTSKGPLIFCQERVGLHGVPFKMYKFRTMEVQDPAEEKKGWTVPNDPRVTGIGRFLRKWSIDEMPQFFNVLVGQMSLVGPRPERPQFVEKFKEEIPRYMVKHQVRPGITGWAQVNGYRGDTSIRKRIEYDLFYIENWTYGFDLRILFATITLGFHARNAY